MSLLTSLEPFFGKHCRLTLGEPLGEISENYWGQTWNLYVFDWTATGEDLRAEILGKANWDGDELPAFAVLNPAADANGLAEIVDQAKIGAGIAGQSGFLFATEEGIQVGDGDFWLLVEDEAAFIGALAVR
jgi:hypothetical protein